MKRGWLFLFLLFSIPLYFFEQNLYYKQLAIYKSTHPSYVKHEKSMMTATIILDDYSPSKRCICGRFVHGVPKEMLQKKYRFILDRKISTLSIESIQRAKKVDVTFLSNQPQYQAPKNIGMFDYDKYLYSKGISGQFFVKSVSSPSGRSIRLSMRTSLQNYLDQTFSHHLLTAVILGEGSAYEYSEELKELGVAHLLAISGLHFGLIYWVMAKLMVFVRNRWVRFVLMVSAMGFMLFFVCPSYSALRAFIVTVVKEHGYFHRQKIDKVTMIVLAASITLMWKPYAVLSSSFYLSYYIYSWIVVVYPRITKSKNPLIFSILLQIFLVPISYYYFGVINIYVFIANVLLIPIFSCILSLSLLLCLTCWVPLWSTVLVYILRSLLSFFDWLMLRMPVHIVAIQPINFKLLMLCFLGMLFIFVFRWLYRYRHIYCGGLFIIFLLLSSHSSDAYISFIDVGHGDCALIKSERGAGLIDCGDGKVDIATLLQHRGIFSVDYVLLSHRDMDHIGGIKNLVESMPVGMIYANESTAERLWKEKYIDASQPITVVKQNQMLSVDDVIIQIYCFSHSRNANDDTLLCHMSMGSITGYFLGDASTNTLRKVPYQCFSEEEVDFIKVPHHGSATSLMPEIYRYISSDLCVISHNTKYHLPSPYLLQHFEQLSQPYRSTYQSGEVQLRKKGLKTAIPSHK